jgi:hypothetical protein
MRTDLQRSTLKESVARGQRFRLRDGKHVGLAWTRGAGSLEDVLLEGAAVGARIGLVTAGTLTAEIMGSSLLGLIRFALLQCIGGPQTTLNQIICRCFTFAAVSVTKFVQSA